MRTFLPRTFIIVTSMLAVATLTQPSHTLPRPQPRRHSGKLTPVDPRLERLTSFFEAMNSPLVSLAQDFLQVADRYHLDWRLLPSISIIESSGGKRCRGNNIFGWDSGQQIFATASEAIHTVADRLANSKLYRDKDLPAVLETYNGNAEYADRVQSVMQRVSREEGEAATGGESSLLK